jgi:phosphatidylglycerophosphatase A
VLFIATGAGSGYLPVAPGTAGAAVGLALYAAGLGTLGAPLYLLTLLAAIAMAVWASAAAIPIFGSKDPKQVTADEVVGMLTTMALVPRAGVLAARPLGIETGLVLGFVFFRLFDILKPFPIRWIERRLPGGFGIVLDDVAAGVFANVALRLVALLLPPS